MKVYLDNSVLNRPFDEQSSPRVHLETVAFLYILFLIEKKKILLVNSSVIEYENSKNPYLNRRKWIQSYLSKARNYQKINQKIKKRAEDFHKENVFPLDALHLSCAEEVGIDYFITCDYNLIKKSKILGLEFEVINPIDFIKLLSKKL